MKAAVDKETCIGCGLCVSVCPAVFELGADSKSTVMGKGTHEKLHQLLHKYNKKYL